MKSYITYERSTGRVLQAGSCQDHLINALSSDTVGVIETPTRLDPSQWRVISGQLQPMPPSPDPTYVFDYATGEWKDPRTLAQARDQAWARVKLQREAAAAQGFDWNGHIIQADPRSLANLSTVANSYLINPPPPGTTIAWTTADNDTVPLTPEQLQQIVAQAGVFVQGLHDRSQQRRQEIDAATDLASIDAIQF